MIDFLLHISKGMTLNRKALTMDHTPFNSVEKMNNAFLYLSDQTGCLRMDHGDQKVFIIGDIIGVHSADEMPDKNPEAIIKDRPGLYYLIIFYRNQVVVYSSLFGILPVYYTETNQQILVASRAGHLKTGLNDRVSVNKQWVLERVLFNHSLDNETPWREIRQLPAHYSLQINEEQLSIDKFLAIEDYFTDRPKPWKQSLGPLAELFSQRCGRYFTEGTNRISFTGGFDGRTLLACALGQKVPVQAYSFGSSINPDILIPRSISARLGIPYTPIFLDRPEYLDAWLALGKEMTDHCDGNTGFLHVHYLYSARKQQGRECLVTGMFGSELMRALHVSGQVTSRPLVDFFIQDEPEIWERQILDSPRLQFLKVDCFTAELNVLWQKLRNLKDELLSLGLSRNQCFYKFIFEETFRKVFGNFIIPQLTYAPVRAPFLDFAFIKALLQTGLAGANNEFFTHNPLKRAKGQVLYARIIQQNYPLLVKELNDKGYCPQALLSPAGKVNIAWGWAKKRFKRRFLPVDYDNLGILSALNQYLIFFQKLELPEYLNSERVHGLLGGRSWHHDILLRDNLLRSLSLAWFTNQGE